MSTMLTYIQSCFGFPPRDANEGPPVLKPLQGDETGKYRIHIVGNSGAGKSTLARELSAMLGVPHISLDILYWGPGWREPSADEFREKVRAALDSNPGGWIVDGVYTRILGTMVNDQATDVIWLDPPLMLYLPRLCWRTLIRLLRLSPPCSPGCEEMVQEVFFSRKSIVWWCITNHGVVRKRQSERYRVDGVHVGGRIRRLGGWGGELAAWKEAVRALSAHLSKQGVVSPQIMAGGTQS